MAVDKRIGDLVLDHLRRLAGILGVDDDLGVGEVGDGIERHMADRIEAGRHGKTVPIRTRHEVAWPTSG